ncbi:uncharacterized protein LOC144138314 [Haemaphysalis longicornis]
MNAFTVILLAVAIAIIGVSATSVPYCDTFPCSEVACPRPWPACACGTYKGICGCCDICYKCANETCNSLSKEVCEENYQCTLDNPEENFATGGVGHCRPHSNHTAQLAEHE